MPEHENKLVIPRLHAFEIQAAKGIVVARAGYRPEVAYEQVRLGMSQEELFECLRRYNEEHGLEGKGRIRPSSPLEEYELSKLGENHEAFENTFERNGKPYVTTVTNMLLRRPGPKEYKEKRGRQDVWRRDVFAFVGCKLAKIAEGQPIPEEGVIMAWDEALGLPRETYSATDSYYHAPGTRPHFYFFPHAEELAILRAGYWYDRWFCFYLSAHRGHEESDPSFGLRAAREAIPSCKKVAEKVPGCDAGKKD